MKRFQFSKLFTWSLAHTAMLTMSISPLAMGKQAENFKAAQMKQFVTELGLNRKTTAQEFWNKSKFYYPGFAYKDIEKAILKNPKQLMPIFEVKSTKNSNGDEIPTVYYTEGGKSYSVQFIGDSEKFLKINNVFISEKETENPKKMMQKVIQSEGRLNQDLQKQTARFNFDQKDKAQRPFRDFRGLPRFNKQLWGQMTLTQKAAYLVEMRLLNEKADQVRLAREKVKPRKTSQLEISEKYQAFLQLFFGQEACAAPYYNGNYCINQGFVAADSSAYNKKSSNYRVDKDGKPLSSVEACNLETILESPKYKSNAMIQKARQQCGDRMPCNPLVYSFDSNGNAFCADPKNQQSFQAGTHFKGSCDSQARLSGSGTKNNDFVDASALGLRKESEQKSDNKGNDLTKVDSEKLQALIKESQAKIKESQAKDSFEATRAYLAGMLKAKGKNDLYDLLQKKEWTPALEEELLIIQKTFEDNIKESMQLCSKDLANKTITHEPNYRDACEQLHRRWLFSKDVIASIKCSDETKGVETQSGDLAVKGTKACAKEPVPAPVVEPAKPACPDGSTETSVSDGNGEMKKMCSCKANGNTNTFEPGPLPEYCAADPAPAPSEVKDCPFKSVKGVDPKTCKCENGDEPKVRYNNNNGEAFSGEPAKEEYYCSGDVNWWLVGGILGGLGLLALLLKNKKKDTKCTNGGNPPECKVATVCTNGGTPPNCQVTTVCVNGGTPPECKVPTTCANGGTPPDCKLPTSCANGGTPPLCTIPSVCSNGGTPPLCELPSSCQGNQVLQGGACVCPSSCSGGATQNPVSCVCTAPPSEGGTGNNTCPNPPCSGGVPVSQ